MSDTVETPEVLFTLNGRELTAEPGELVIAAAERHGVYIPRFCYHERMRPVGMCRMCLVEVDAGRGPALSPSCMLEVTPDMVVETESEATQKAQEGVLEFLLINHPLDCPVCDKGGECPLQDQTVAFGPGESRFVEEKRHYEKPIAISELVQLDRERCILCDRCTRFSSEVAGDPLIQFMDRGSQTEVNTFPDHPFASYFSGNTVQICPVGALTASPYRFKARPWDLVDAESTCQGCSVGCRISVDTSRDRVLRYQGVDIDPVNWGWLCDKGRFGFEAIANEGRLGQPLIRENDELVEASWATALSGAARALRSTLESNGRDSVGVIGGARLTNEDAYAWTKFAKGLLGTDNVDCQIGDGLPADLVLGLPRATIDEVCTPGGTVLLLGPDLKEELPVLHLRLRHAVVEDGVKVIEVCPQRSSFSEYAALSLHPRPGETGAVVRALAGEADGSEVGGVSAGDLAAGAAMLAVAAGEPKVIVGRQSVAETEAPIVDAVAALVDGLDGCRFLPVLRRANVAGALDMGMAPGVLPGRVGLAEGRDWYRDRWPMVPESPGLGTIEMLEAAVRGDIDTLILVGADLFDLPDRDLAVKALERATVIALDLFRTPSVEAADYVFPAAGFAECDGTTTNIEGRISAVSQRVTPPGTARSDWMIAAELARRLDSDLGLESPAQIWDEIESIAPSHRGITSLLLRSPRAAAGVVVPVDDTEVFLDDLSIPVTITTTAVHGRTGVTLSDLAPADKDEQADEDEAVSEGPTADESEDAAADGGADGDGSTDTLDEAQSTGPALPPAIEFTPRGGVSEPATNDAYALRLVASRRLYDVGTLVRHAPSLARLAGGTTIRINPYDFDRLDVAEGDDVQVTSSQASFTAEVVLDDGVPRGSASMVFNQPEIEVAELIDAKALVNEVRVETVGGAG